MTSFTTTVKLCKDPATGSSWLHLPHVSSQRGCAPALCSLCCCPTVSHPSRHSPASHIATKPTVFNLVRWAGGRPWLLSIPWPMALVQESSGTFADTFSMEKVRCHTVLYRRQKSELFLFTSVYQFRQLWNQKVFPFCYLSLHYFDSKIPILPLLSFTRVELQNWAGAQLMSKTTTHSLIHSPIL